MTDRPIVFDTPDDIAAFRLLALRRALQLEIKTGMKAGPHSLVKVANRTFGTTYRTKKQCLDHANALLADFDQHKEA